LPYPSTLLPIDINGLRTPGSIFQHPSGGFEHRLDENLPIYQTIIDGDSGSSSINASATSLDATIDLRPGQPSFLRDGNEHPSTWIMSEFSTVNLAIGGSGNDFIRGNHNLNTLDGNAGDDIIIGGVGSDRLRGGAGNDYYSYRLGHGNDFIDEEDQGGVETLRIESVLGFEGLADLRFQKLGNDLKITLELGGPDRNADAIVIENMGRSESAVERLALLNEGTFLGAVSLPSVWAHADQEPRRFELQSGRDEFGRLAAPCRQELIGYTGVHDRRPTHSTGALSLQSPDPIPTDWSRRPATTVQIHGSVSWLWRTWLNDRDDTVPRWCGDVATC
jgi:hypothetical protein